MSVSCALCGRPVEVHTILRLEGQEVVIGGSCAKLVAGGGRVRTTVVPDYHALARGNGWTLWRQNGTDNARLAGRNAAHPAVLALVARDYPGLTLDTGPGLE